MCQIHRLSGHALWHIASCSLVPSGEMRKSETYELHRNDIQMDKTKCLLDSSDHFPVLDGSTEVLQLLKSLESIFS